MTSFVLYVCWECGATIKWPDPSISTPQTTCGPHYDNETGAMFMVHMTPAVPAQPRQETER